MSEEKSFYSKILLFGEYSIIKNSMALSMPYSLFEGHLKFRRDKSQGKDQELKSLAEYLKNIRAKDGLFFDMDVASFEFDVSQGLYFDSTIPQGFGAGSSGALCAAIYDRYGTSVEENCYEISELKRIFALIESHFHGSSSGVDPLISYLNKSILVRSDLSLGQVKIPDYKSGQGALFLLNTGRSRKTEPLVNLFLEKTKNQNFSDVVEKELLPVTNNCIMTFLEGEIESLLKNFRELSWIQSQHFTPMIPKLFLDIWNQGLSSDDYYLKLCGAGGGGFLLGITKDFKKAQASLSNHEIRPLCRF